MNVILFKFTNGEEVIARCSNNVTMNAIFDQMKVIELENPMMVQPYEVKKGQYGITLVPLFMSSPNSTIVVPVTNIGSVVVNIDPGLEKEYLSKTSGIELLHG
jgi:hypothetical protein